MILLHVEILDLTLQRNRLSKVLLKELYHQVQDQRAEVGLVDLIDLWFLVQLSGQLVHHEKGPSVLLGDVLHMFRELADEHL